MRETVSVIVPVYNVEKYLSRCVSSITRQSYNQLEIILVDDGSTDSSGMMCDEIAKEDNRIRVIHKANGGLSDARNKGIEVALGEWIMFVDSDDLIAPDMVEELVNVAEKNGSQIAICDPVHIFDDGADGISFEKESKSVTYKPLEAISEMWYQRSFLPSAWGKIYRTELFNDIRFTTGILFEDIDIMHELFVLAETIVYTNARFYAYMHRENSITTQRFSDREFDILNICDKLIEFSRNRSEEIKKAALAYSVVGNMRVYASMPMEEKYDKQRKICEQYIKKVGISVIGDKNLRRKTKLGIVLFFVSKKLFVYMRSKINRWK